MSNSFTNTTNRDWSTSEEADISCYKAPFVKIECWENTALVQRNPEKPEIADEYIEFDVYVYAVADNLYLATKTMGGRVYLTDTLQDCLDTAALMVYED
jgi:hypothetical protein